MKVYDLHFDVFVYCKIYGYLELIFSQPPEYPYLQAFEK